MAREPLRRGAAVTPGVRVRTGFTLDDDPLTGTQTYRAVVRLSEVDERGLEVGETVRVFEARHADKRDALAQAREAAQVVLEELRRDGPTRCLKCPHEAHLTICRHCGCCSPLDLTPSEGRAS